MQRVSLGYGRKCSPASTLLSRSGLGRRSVQQFARRKELSPRPTHPMLWRTRHPDTLKDVSPLRWSPARILTMDRRDAQAKEEFLMRPTADGAKALAEAYTVADPQTAPKLIRRLYRRVVYGALGSDVLRQQLEASAFADAWAWLADAYPGEKEKLLRHMEELDMVPDTRLMRMIVQDGDPELVTASLVERALDHPSCRFPPSLLRELESLMLQRGDLFVTVRLLELRAAKAGEVDLSIVGRLAAEAGRQLDVRTKEKLLELTADPSTLIEVPAPQRIQMLGSFGEVEAATDLFREEAERVAADPFATRHLYTEYLRVLDAHRLGGQAAELWEKAVAGGSVLPDGELVYALVSACVHSGLGQKAREVVESMESKYGLTASKKIRDLLVIGDVREGRREDVAAAGASAHSQRAWATLGDHKKAISVSQSLAEAGELTPDVFRLWMRSAMALEEESERLDAVADVWEEFLDLQWPMPSALAYTLGTGEAFAHDHLPASVDAAAISVELQKQEKELAAAGYRADVTAINSEMFEEPKEAVTQCSHSERLALAHAFVKDRKGKSDIIVRKEGTVCDDCHSAFRLLAKICKRRISVISDGHFHTFEGEAASCGGFHLL